jgi:hypothetical protein
MVHGEVWTLKEFFVYPNEYIYWSIQIVMYPFMTGLVAGAFVLSSLYHVFGVKALKEFGELVDGDIEVAVAPGHSGERAQDIQPPVHERP